jgi:hypothetical protein
MTKKFQMVIVLLTIFFVGATLTPSFAGKHYGELKMIEANIEFLNPRGQCITDSTGITYIIDGRPTHLDIVYPAEYWGTYPLYLPTATVPVNLTITNLGPRSIAKHTVVTDAYVINYDGSQGEPLFSPQVSTVEVALGETEVINGSFILPAVGKSLNMFSMKLYHHYNPDSPDSSLILNQKAVFCPPELLQ